MSDLTWTVLVGLALLMLYTSDFTAIGGDPSPIGDAPAPLETLLQGFPPPTLNHGDVAAAARADVLASLRLSDFETEEQIALVPAVIAWRLRAEGCGLLHRSPGHEGIASLNGNLISIKRVVYPNGQLFKVLSDAGVGGANGAEWADDGPIDVSEYVAPFDPGI